jgi:hypothetical protein
VNVISRVLLATVLAFLLLMAGCGGDPEADPLPSFSPDNQPSASASPSGGPPPGWENKFTAQELSAAYAALNDWERWRDLRGEIYRKGKVTESAKRYLQQYSFNWQRDLVDLEVTYQEGGVRIITQPTARWAYVKSITIDKNGFGYGFIVQCTDYNDVLVTQNGKEVSGTKPKNLVTPLVIRMVKPDADHGWMQDESTLKDAESCN